MTDNEITPTSSENETDRIDRPADRPAPRRRGLLIGGIVAASLGVIALTAGITTAIVDEFDDDDRDDVVASEVSDRADRDNDRDGGRDDADRPSTGALDADIAERAIAAAVEATGGDAIDVELSDDRTSAYEVSVLVDGVEHEVELDEDFAVVSIEQD